MHPLNRLNQVPFINPSRANRDSTESTDSKISQFYSVTAVIISSTNHKSSQQKNNVVYPKRFAYPFCDPLPLDFDGLKPVDNFIGLLKTAIRSRSLNSLQQILSKAVISKETLQKAIKFAFKNNRFNEFKLLIQYLPHDRLFLETLFLKEIEKGGFSHLEILKDKIKYTPQFLAISFELAVANRNFYALDFLKPFEIEAAILLKHIFEGIKIGDYLIAVELYQFKIDEDNRYKIFQEACFFERYTIIENFIEYGVKPFFLGDAFLKAVRNNKSSLIHFLSRYTIESFYVDLALELSVAESNINLLREIFLFSPSQRGLGSCLLNAAAFNNSNILHQLLNYNHFSNQQIAEAALIAEDSRSEQALSFLINYLHVERNVSFIESDVDPDLWCLEIALLRQRPEEFLQIWHQSAIKPTKIIFSDQEGIGDGIKRQFYSELIGSIITKAFDEDGLPHSQYFNYQVFGQLASLISFMLEHDIKTGKIFSKKWLKVIHSILSSNGFIRFCFLNIYRNTMDESRQKRNQIYNFLDKSTKENLKILIKKYGHEPEFMGLFQLPQEEQIKSLRNLLIYKFGDRCLMDFLEQRKEVVLTNFNLDGLALEIIQNIYGENIQSIEQAIYFCIDIEKQFWKKAWDVFETSKTFLNECSPDVLTILQNSQVEEIEGCLLDDVYKLDIHYEGYDEGIKQKIAFLKEVLREKCLKKEYEWLGSFVHFYSASLGFSIRNSIGVAELEPENYPQSQTCFYLLKLSRGFDETPKHLLNWQERFLYKLDIAIKETGFQFD
jgi:hypothetical protein